MEYVRALQATANFIRDGQDLKFENFCAVDLPLPSFEEQVLIATTLDGRLKGLSAACDRAKREIELLREYRTRLIADVVTGKLDVREAATRLPVESDQSEDAEVDEDRATDQGDAEVTDRGAEQVAAAEEP